MADTQPRVSPGLPMVDSRQTARALLFTTLFASLTALGAHVAIRTPFTPVPVTLQVFFVLLSGAMLGRLLGALAQAQYLAIGGAGRPRRAGGAAGLAAFAGPSAGYLPGFVLAAWVIGRISEAHRRSALPMAGAMLAGLAAIYLPGALWLALWLRATSAGTWEAALSQSVLLGVVPFLAVDALKAVAVAGIATGKYRNMEV